MRASAHPEPTRVDPLAGAPEQVDRRLIMAGSRLRAGDREGAATVLTALLAVPELAVTASRLLGTMALEDGRPAAAIDHYMRAVDLDPGSPESLHGLARSLERAGHHDLALMAYERMRVHGPDYAKGLDHYLAALIRVHRLEDAIAVADGAIARLPKDQRLHLHKARALYLADRAAEGADVMREVVRLVPSNGDLRVMFGVLLRAAGDLGAALDSFRAGVRKLPDSPLAAVLLHEAKCIACDWSGLESLERTIRRLPVLTDGAAPPFNFLNIPFGPAEQAKQSAAYAARFPVTPMADHEPLRATAANRRIRLGYLSADLHYHATSMLAAGLFESHDRSRFEVFAYSLGPVDNSALRARVVAAFDRFYDCRGLPDPEIAARIATDGIDLLIDLKGFTKGAREGVLARRPAPVQVAYLGYPGPLMAPFIDYQMVDAHVVPPQDQAHYLEELVHLPHCYQVNDRTRAIADWRPTRAELGLPETGVVFASMNAPYKIKPPVFDVWMKILHRVPNSVLWLLCGEPLAEANLRREAVRRRIAPDRLVFAARTPADRHLARLAVADLFLDTAPISAHTTASDALWAGLPLVTVSGETFVGRVAGSLLKAVGLPDLITPDFAAYQDLAVALAEDPARLSGIRARLAEARLTAPLFDTVRQTRAIERAYETMVARWRAGLPPQGFAVPAEG